MEKNMKNIFKVTALACLMAAASNAVAAGPTANVQVKGTVVQGACTPSLSGGGVVDIGTFSVDQLVWEPTKVLQAEQEISMSIACSAPTKVAFTSLDNRHDSVADYADRMYRNRDANGLGGLGFTSTGIKIGSFYLTVSTIPSTADGTAIDLIGGPLAGPWVRERPNDWVSYLVNTGNPDYTAFATKGTLTPISITNATVNFMLRAGISTKMSAIIENETVDGNMTFELHYL